MGENQPVEDRSIDDLTLYQRYIVRIYEEKIATKGITSEDEIIRFGRDDIDFVKSEYDLQRMGNPPDIVYNLRGRKQLPSQLREVGYEAVIHDVSRESTSASYALTKRKQWMDPPVPRFNTRVELNGVSDLVLDNLVYNEQGVFRLFRDSGIVGDIVNAERCSDLQQHVTSGSKYGQTEIDALFVFEDDEGVHTIIVEGKGADEVFTRNQLRKNVLAVRESEDYVDPKYVLGYRPAPGEKGVLTIIEFEVPPFPEDGMVQIVDQYGYRFPELSTHQTLFEATSDVEESEGEDEDTGGKASMQWEQNGTPVDQLTLKEAMHEFAEPIRIIEGDREISSTSSPNVDGESSS